MSVAHSQHTFQFQIATITAAGITCLVTTAISPLLTSCVLWLLGIQLFLSKPNWDNIAKIDQPVVQTHLDQSIKIMIGACVLLSATFIIQLHVVSQMVLLTAAGAGLCSYFMFACIKRSQTALNQGLHEAAQSLNQDALTELLRRGADPFAPDQNLNNAHHLVIQNKAESLEALTNLINQPPAPDLEKVGDALQTLWDDEVFQQFKLIWEKTKEWSGDRTQENFYPVLDGFKQLLDIYQPKLSNLLNAIVGFMRGEIAFPKNLQQKNRGGNSALELINLVVEDNDLKTELRNILSTTPSACVNQSGAELHFSPNPESSSAQPLSTHQAPSSPALTTSPRL